MEEKIMDAIGVVFTGSDSDGDLWARIDADGNVVPDPGQAFFDTHPVWGGIKDVVIDGQHMVLIPAFYIKRTWLTAGLTPGTEESLEPSMLAWYLPTNTCCRSPPSRRKAG